MATAIFLPLVILAIYAKRKYLFATVSILLLLVMSVLYWAEIQAMMNPYVISNEVKLRLLDDYYQIFSYPMTLLFGQGLGTYYYWTFRSSFYFITELTYFEIIRNYGIFIGFIMVMMMFYPVFYSFYLNKSFNERHIIIGYVFYLGMTATNPLFFSSMGILILAIIMANIYLFKNRLTTILLYHFSQWSKY